MELYIFNPEHDYALANNDPHFMAPASSVRFAADCALFLQHVTPDDSVIYLPYAAGGRFFSTSEKRHVPKPASVSTIKPWGWDPLVLRQIQEVFPGWNAPAGAVESVRRTAHRRNTAEALAFLRSHCAAGMEFPEPAAELFHTEEMEAYVRERREVIFKSPFSGNGRGHLYAHGSCPPTLLRQGAGVIRRQGSILAEPLYDVAQDFAMEFRCQDGDARFAGYSLFNTSHYGYAGNHLLPDAAIEDRLSLRFPRERLHDVRDALERYLQLHVAPVYDGYVGVDMFLHRQGGQTRLNPMVEMNIRMTMGMVAHILTERHLHPKSGGIMRLEHDAAPGGLLRRARQRPPLVVRDGRWVEGFASLNPIGEETQYAITVHIHKTHP